MSDRIRTCICPAVNESLYHLTTDTKKALKFRDLTLARGGNLVNKPQRDHELKYPNQVNLSSGSRQTAFIRRCSYFTITSLLFQPIAYKRRLAPPGVIYSEPNLSLPCCNYFFQTRTLQG